MVQFNFADRTIKTKVVYYGPAQSGKTTNLEQIHRLTDPVGNNRLISLNTAQDRTLFFDLLPFSLGSVAGYSFLVQIYTVPGQVQYNATRRVVLAGADAVVFVADSQRSVLKENVAAFENMKVNLLANRLVPEKVPLVLQWNKQDLADPIPAAELARSLNLWGRRAVPAVAARGEGVMETFVAVVEDMLSNIAVKYNLKEKGLDPAAVPQLVKQAFSRLLDAAPRPASAPTVPPPRVVISQPPDTGQSLPAAAGAESAPVSEELLHRAIRSNVELAEALGSLTRDVMHGLGTILAQADLLLIPRDESQRVAAVAAIQREASRLRHRMQDLGQASVAPAVPQVPRPTPQPAGPPSTVQPPSVPLEILPFDRLLIDAIGSVRAPLQARGLRVEMRVAPNSPAPRCPQPSLRRATAALFEGLAEYAHTGSILVVRSERKPVLLKSRDGEVRRDFLMLAVGHSGTLSSDDQARIQQGTQPGPFGDAWRMIREMGGFIRFAPLPGGALETRVFFPAP